MQWPPTDTARRQARETLDDLAIFSGEAAFAEPLHVGRPNIGDRATLLDRIAGALDRQWLTNDGQLLARFETKVAELTAVRECIVVVNATVGLQLLARALGLSGEVIMPSWTFIGTANAFSWVGLTPVFCDVDPATHNIEPDAVAQAITGRTSAVLGVHLWGRACDAERLGAIAEQHQLALIFDAAHALACTHRGRPIGSLGNAEVFSFHATKIATAGEGGAITTNDAELAQRLRRMRSFGFCAYDAVSELGTNAKMNELSAAMGLTSLESLDEFVEVCRRNHASYARGLEQADGVRLLTYDDGQERHNYHYVVCELDHPPGGLTRDDLIAVLHAENVLARRYFHPGCHRMQPYDTRHWELPATEDVSSKVVVLPTGTSITEHDIQTICSIVRVATHYGAELHGRLERT